jgi:hypothetical protein
MPQVAKSPRARLRQALEKRLQEHESIVLRQALEGLVALDYGEVREMFAPGSKNWSKLGTKPYTLRKLQMEALGFADLLIANKFQGEEAAIRTVAEAYGQKADTFRGWRKRLGKTTDPLMKSFRAEIAKLDWDEVHVLSHLKKTGAQYQTQEKVAFQAKK